MTRHGNFRAFSPFRFIHQIKIEHGTGQSSATRKPFLPATALLIESLVSWEGARLRME